jgi:thiamine-monophosphate kinase
VAEALALHEAARLHALIDISDGLAAVLGHILKESGGLGAVLDADSIPIHDDARLQSREDARTPLEHALHDGEDFELCVVVPPDEARRLLEAPPVPAVVHAIGVIVEEPGIRLRRRDGSLATIEPRGFDHLRAE